MYNNINPNHAIEYDPDIIFKIKEMIKDGFDKLKSFVKSNNEKSTKIPNFNFFNELNQQFGEISIKLKESKLCVEYNYFLSIQDYVLYIVHQNSIDSSFGHCNFTLELLDFFMELFKTNVNFYKSSLKIENEDFKIIQTKFKEQYWEYRSHFYCDIYQSNGDFTDEEMYEIHKSLRS